MHNKGLNTGKTEIEVQKEGEVQRHESDGDSASEQENENKLPEQKYTVKILKENGALVTEYRVEWSPSETIADLKEFIRGPLLMYEHNISVETIRICSIYDHITGAQSSSERELQDKDITQNIGPTNEIIVRVDNVTACINNTEQANNALKYRPNVYDPMVPETRFYTIEDNQGIHCVVSVLEKERNINMRKIMVKCLEDGVKPSIVHLRFKDPIIPVSAVKNKIYEFYPLYELLLAWNGVGKASDDMVIPSGLEMINCVLHKNHIVALYSESGTMLEKFAMGRSEARTAAEMKSDVQGKILALTNINVDANKLKLYYCTTVVSTVAFIAAVGEAKELRDSEKIPDMNTAATIFVRTDITDGQYYRQRAQLNHSTDRNIQ